jgi:hypothetical protein
VDTNCYWRLARESGAARIQVMALPTEFHTRDLPTVFANFRKAIGERHWVKRSAAVRADMRGHKYLQDLLERENDVAIALARCSEMVKQYGDIPLERTDDRSLYPAFQLATQTMALIDQASPKYAKALTRRIHGAFKNPDDMRALQFELSVATHFTRRGLHVQWPEMTGVGTFDLLVDGLDTQPLEVECKSISDDKGRRVHRREALEALNHLRLSVETAAHNLLSGLAVVVTLRDRLPTAFKARQELLNEIARAILVGVDLEIGHDAEVRIRDFDIAKYPDLGPPMTEALRRDIDEITGTINRQAMILGRRKRGALVVVIQSRQDDSLLDYTFAAAGDAAARQLTRTRPGIVAIGFDGISPSQLVRTAQQDHDPKNPPTQLRRAVSSFLDSEQRRHLIGVAFLSHNELERMPGGHLSTGGTAYYFPQTDSHHWAESYRGLFQNR